MKFYETIFQKNLKDYELIVELVLLVIIVLIALYVGFYDSENLTHPLHGDLVLTGNTAYNIHNNIPYMVNGSLQWLDERVHYFYVSPLGFYYAALFWDNSRDYIPNLILPNILLVIFSYLVVYLFVRRYFGRNIALLGIFLMSLSTYWYNYVVRSLYIPWVALPGFCFLIYWLYVKFNEKGKIKLMAYAGLIAGLGFYFTSWPLLVTVIPSLFVLIFILPSEISKKKRFLGCFLCILIITLIILTKEFIFLQTGLRYEGDPSGIDSFSQIFYQRRFVSSYGNDFSYLSIISLIKSRLYSLYILIFFPTPDPNLTYVITNIIFQQSNLPAIPLISPFVLLTAIPGLLLMLFQKRYIDRFLPVYFLFTLIITAALIFPVSRYFIPIFPILYIASAFFIINFYVFIKYNKFNEKYNLTIFQESHNILNNYKTTYICIIFICIISAGILWNIYETDTYMEKVLPTYSKFEYNCYNSIEWSFPELKTFLKERRTIYDLIVIPNSFTGQMVTYFRLQPGFVHLEGESYGKRVIPYNTFRNEIENINKRADFSKVLIIANNYNQLLNDQICPGWSNRLPYDKNALTMSEVEKLVPGAKFVKYVGSKNYPTMLALYEINPSIKPETLVVVNPPLPALPNKLPPGPAYSSGNYTDATTPIGHYKAEYAFDGNKNTLWHSPPPAGTLGWIVRDFDKPTKISMFTITIRSDMTDQAPSFFVVSGSQDGKEWIPLGAINELQWEKGETKLFALNKNEQYYKLYKFDFISSVGNDVFVSIVDMDLFGE